MNKYIHTHIYIYIHSACLCLCLPKHRMCGVDIHVIMYCVGICTRTLHTWILIHGSTCTVGKRLVEFVSDVTLGA